MSAQDTQAPTRSKRPTLKTIAYMTGLGVTTVSRALNDAPDISQSTKARVRLVARQIGYRPNRAGVRLRTGKTNVISLILTVEHEVLPAGTQLVHGISAVLAETPYHLIVTPYLRGTDPLEPVRYVVETGSADGVIMSRIEPQDSRVAYLARAGLPFATHGRTELGIDHPYADFDNEEYARIAVERLVSQGRRKLTVLTPPPRLAYAEHIAKGFQTAVEMHDLDDIPLRTVTTDNMIDEIAEAVEKLVRRGNRPDGIVCSSANSAIGAIAGIEQAGLTLGQDIDVVVKEGFGLMTRFRKDISVVFEDFTLAGNRLAEAVVRSIGGTPARELQFLQHPCL